MDEWYSESRNNLARKVMNKNIKLSSVLYIILLIYSFYCIKLDFLLNFVIIIFSGDHWFLMVLSNSNSNTNTNTKYINYNR